MTALRLFVCHSLLVGIMFSVVHADWTLSVRLINYYKPYSVLETAGATGTAYCCCDCSNTGFRCCDSNVDTVNDRCVVRKCPTHFRVCARQGSGSEICSNTTSPFELNSTFTFSEGGTYGGLQNPIHLTANQDSTSDKITLVVSIMERNSTGQSLGSSTVMIPPQTTTTYTNMTFNNNKEKPLTAQLTYAYKLNCSDCPSSGNPNNTNNTNNTTGGTNITNSTNTNGTDGTNITSVNVNCSLSVRLINYYKPYSVLETAGARGSAYCCCDCSFIGFSCCERNVDTANDRCVVRSCPTNLTVCARQGSGSEICSNTTSPFKLDTNSTFTFSEGGTYGGLQNPIHLTANNLSSDNNITLVVSIMEGDFTVMIPPQTTTTYTNMTFNNNKEKPLTAQLIYAYKLNCSSTNGNGSNGINTTDSTTSTSIYSPSSTGSPSPTGIISSSSTAGISTGSSTGNPNPSPNPTTNSTGSSSTMIKSSLWMLILITLLSAILIQF